VPKIGPPGLTRRGLETGPWRTYTGTKLETADTAKGSLPVPRQSSTLLMRGCWRRSDGPLEGDTHPKGEKRPGLARPERHRASVLLYWRFS
jgi:hypothetical protein